MEAYDELLDFPIHQTETIRQLVKVLKVQGQWQPLIDSIKASIKAPMESLSTPEQAFRVTQDLKAVTRIFAQIEAIAEGTK